MDHNVIPLCYLLPSALVRGIESRIVARIDSKCCMYVCMYVFPSRFWNVISLTVTGKDRLLLYTTCMFRACACSRYRDTQGCQETERRTYCRAKATTRKRKQRQSEAERGTYEDTKRKRRGKSCLQTRPWLC